MQEHCTPDEGANTTLADAGAAWAARAAELSRWAWDRYVIRADVWGGYIPVAERDVERVRPDGTKYTLGATCTRPAKRNRGRVKLTPAVLERHFCATVPERVAGIHTTSPENYSKFGTVEVDKHGEGGNDAEANLRAAQAWYDALRGRGFRPLLWDSNGRGGYHLDILFAAPVPTPALFWYLRELVADHATHGLPARPETFPKQPSLKPTPDGRGKYGNWVRLIGRHHTRDHWARVWDGSEWLEGAAAVEFVLALAGDPPELIPADMEVRGRVKAFMRKLPNLGEGQGRDNVAFGFGAFLVRDLGLSDAEALAYLQEWDAGNSPPKGEERLCEILRNAHTYGQNGYASARGHAGRNGDGQLPAVPPSAPPPREDHTSPGDGLSIILADFRKRYEPTFRRGTAIYSAKLDREVKPSEATFGADRPLLEKLATASDAPCDKRGETDLSALPKFFWTWAKSAWQELIRDLPEEEESAEVADSAEEEFRRRVASCLFSQATFTVDGEAERRTLLQWAALWAKPGPWKEVRAALLWCRKDDQDRLCIALRVELFGQYGPRELAALSYRRFAALAELYGVGTSSDDNRPGGKRAVVLDHDYLTGLRETPKLPDCRESRAGAHARETSGNPAKSGANAEI